MKFGWLPDQQTYETATVCIKALPDFQEGVSTVRESGYVHEGWFCTPIQVMNVNSRKPYPPVPVPWFPLPLTHEIEHQCEASPSELSEFLVTVFGWSQGLRLQPEGWGHFYRVALELHKLTDFIVFKPDVTRVLDLAETFWHRHRADGIAASMFGAVHWFLFSQSYHQYFERFMMQYMVFDTLYHVHISISGIKRNSQRHAGRAEYLAQSLNIPLPSWGVLDSTGKSVISQLRNELFHEAKFGGAAIGFTFPEMQGNILLSLQAFNSRLIAALLGATGGYTCSSSETRQMHQLSID